ncbi:oxygenase [Thermomonospora echinospora]|uniref:Oxygenase n=1 Tax=Thermomonospora echinospora TaxID=1992 RepID=A0A1H5VE34_9ACTN|nr:FAD-dependent monooxygenase [Thermomonospora echinospora]SEF85622.1 oxygenase [Thermomonospora echinospora]
MPDPAAGPATDVVVVGAGPVGLMLAGELRLGGARVVVLERRAAPSAESRASTLHARTMEILDERGLLGVLGTPPNEPRGHFGGLPLDFGGLPSPFPGQWKVPQPRTEALLRSWATGLGADLWQDHELTGLAESNDGVEAYARGPSGRVCVRASYLVGCDGEDSTVRELAGFAFPGRAAARELLRADVRGVRVRDRRFERTSAGMAVAATRDGLTRVMAHEFGRPPVPRAGAPSFAEVAAVWARVTGEDIGGGTPVWVNAFDDACRQVSSYRRGRVLLAGDAAHRQLPAGGQALNLGLQDAWNLGWRLAARVRGDGGDELLDGYHEERHAVGARVLTNVQAQALLLLGDGETDPLRAVLGELLAHGDARRRLAETISGLDVRYPVGDGPLTGARLPHCPVITDQGAVSTAALLRPARGLLLDLSGRGAFRAAAADWAGRVPYVIALADRTGPLAGLGGLLARPDGHVVWTGSGTADPAGLRAALHRWYGAPAPDRPHRKDNGSAQVHRQDSPGHRVEQGHRTGGGRTAGR